MNMQDLSTVRWRKSSRSGDTGGNCVEVGGLWRKSSRSMDNGGQCVEVGGLWRKSSHSTDTGGACVEVADLSPAVAVRDSKDPDGPKLLFAAAHWQAFANRVKVGAHDLG